MKRPITDTVVAIAALATCAVACAPARPPHEPPYTNTDRDRLDTPIGQVCATLRRHGCPEGWPNRRGRTCFESYTTAAEFALVPATCLKAASSEEDVRACGDANTIRVRCVLPTVDVAASTAP